MPQVDLETLFCGGDFKVSCETMIGGEDPAAKRPEEDPDMPAESIQIRIGDEIDWTDINAVYERDDSTKGNTNPKSQHANQKQQPQQQPTSNSQRFSGNLKPKAPIIALPNKIRHSSYLGASVRRIPKASTLLNKKKAGGGGRKSALPPPEPGSPKVSCFGKVLSDRERERSHHIRPISAPPTVDHEESRRHPRSGGCFARLMAMFRCRRPATREYEDDDDEASTLPEKNLSWPGRPSAALAMEGSSVVAPAGLGAVRRFSSGRRPASWGGDEDIDGSMHVACSAPLDQEEEESMMGSRSVG